MKSSEKSGCCGAISARVSLGVLSSAGLMVLYMLRINLSVAIVAMVDVKQPAFSGTHQNISSHLSSNSNIAFCAIKSDLGNVSASHGESPLEPGDEASIYNTTSSVPGDEIPTGEKSSKMELTGEQKGLVLGSFFYGYVFTNIAGGRLAEIYGTKKVLGGSILSSALLTLLTPLAARTHYILLVLLRMLIGIVNGVVFPAMNTMIVRWVPPLERPRFISFVYAFPSVGTILTLSMCGVIIKLWGWPSVFYITGGVSLFWVLLWALLMHDTPQEHPRISQKEKDFILESLKEEMKKTRPSRTPWRAILTSVPLWAATFAQIGILFTFNLLLTQLPTYMDSILGFSIASNGVLSSLPFLSGFLGNISSGVFGGWLLDRKYLTVNFCRKLFATTSIFVPGLLMVVVGYSGCNATMAVTILCVGLFFEGSCCSAHLANYFDLSPNFAGTILGVSSTVGFLVSTMVPVIVGAMTHSQTLGQWQGVFWMTAGVSTSCWIIFMTFSSTEIQPWNHEQEEEGEEGEEGDRGAEKEEEEEEEGGGGAEEEGYAFLARDKSLQSKRNGELCQLEEDNVVKENEETLQMNIHGELCPTEENRIVDKKEEMLRPHENGDVYESEGNRTVHEYQDK